MAQLSLQCACVHGFRPDDGLAFIIIIITFAEFKVASALQHVGLGACTGTGFPLNFGSLPDQGVDVSMQAWWGSAQAETCSALVMGSRVSGHDMVCQPAWKSRAQKTLAIRRHSSFF